VASENAQAIAEVHVSQDAPSLLGAVSSRFGEPALTIRAIDEAVPMLGAVMSYGAIVAPLQAAWLETQARGRAPLQSLRQPRDGAEEVDMPRGVEVDSGIAERFDLAVVAEGGVFATAAKSDLVAGAQRPALRHDYGQTAWVGSLLRGWRSCRHRRRRLRTLHAPRPGRAAAAEGRPRRPGGASTAATIR
jgi:2-octaprenyl-6-methoxyphenol hydroxylase